MADPWEPDTEMRWHQFAMRFPLLEGEEWISYKGSIKATGGNQVPISYRIIGDGEKEYLDGRNRAKACIELELPCSEEEVDVADDDVKQFIIIRNINRRHLTKEFRLELVAELRADGKSIRTIAGTLGTSRSTVGRDVHDASQEPVPNGTPEKVTGKDGKTYSATKPQTVFCVSCERRRRKGQELPAKCADCKEARKPKLIDQSPQTTEGDANEGPPPPEILKDACGFVVPAHVAPAFAAASEMGKVCRDLDQIGKRVDELAKGAGGSGLHLSSITQSLKAVRKTIWQSRPVYVCPYCQAKGECEACNAGGWATKTDFEQAPEHRRIAMGAKP